MFSLNSFFCLFPELSPWGHSPDNFSEQKVLVTWNLGGGTEKAGWVAVGKEGRAREGGNGSQGRRNQEHPARLQTDTAGRHGLPRAPGSHLLVGRRGFRKETEEEAHLVAGLENLKRQTVWSGQVSCLGVTRRQPRLAPKEGRKLGAPEQFSKWGESEPHAPVWALALPCSPPPALAAGCLGVP